MRRSSRRRTDRIAVTVYRIVAEALANAAAYAQASVVRIELRVEGRTVRLSVRDDGVGGADPKVGTGLRGLADRVAALDGRLEVHSPPGEGTLVRANIPCASS